MSWYIKPKNNNYGTEVLCDNGAVNLRSLQDASLPANSYRLPDCLASLNFIQSFIADIEFECPGSGLDSSKIGVTTYNGNGYDYYGCCKYIIDLLILVCH